MMSFCVNRIINEGRAVRWHLDPPPAAIMGTRQQQHYLEVVGYRVLTVRRLARKRGPQT